MKCELCQSANARKPYYLQIDLIKEDNNMDPIKYSDCDCTFIEENILNKHLLKIKEKINIIVIFKNCKDYFWTRFFLTKSLIRFLIKSTTIHFKVVYVK